MVLGSDPLYCIDTAGYTRELKEKLRAAKCFFVRRGKGDHEIWYSPISRKNFPVDSDIKSRHTAMPFFSKPD